jgi:Acetyltransferase (GNAT) domain
MIDFRVIDTATLYQSAVQDARCLFEEVFHRQFPPDIWDQWYFKNPYGDPLVVMGYVGSRAVAHHAFIPQRLVNGAGEELPYMLSMSSMVAEQWRSWTSFNQMMNLLHQGASERGHKMTLVLPNAKASELYRVLYRYRTFIETPLCTWTPDSNAAAGVAQAQPASPEGTKTFSYPADATYWNWRTSVNRARSVDFGDGSKLVLKISENGVLTILDVLARSCPQGGERLADLARSLGAATVRVTALHANALGLGEQDLVPHEGYIVRLMYRHTSDETPAIRFNLLLSDAF